MKNTVGGHHGEGESPRWPALVLCIVAGFMTLLDVSIVNIAVPSMTSSLGMSSADVSWAVTGYTLAFGLTLIPAGRLGDVYGRKRMFLIGLSLFTATAILCGAAPNATVLIVGRLLRGISAGMLAPQAIALLQQMYDGPRRGRAFGYYGATVGMSTAIGPLLGGVILRIFGTADGWRFVFYLSLPILIATLVVALPVLPADRRCRRRGEQPPAAPGLLRVRGYLVGTMIAATFYAGFTSIFLVLTVFLQQGLKYSALQAALATLTFTVSSTCCAVVSGRVVHRLGRRIVVLGSALATAGLSLVALVAAVWTGGDMALVLTGPLLVAGCGCGLVIAANQILTLREVTRGNVGLAAGVYDTGQRLGTAIGTGLTSAAFFGALANEPSDYHGAAGLGLSIAALLVGLGFVIAMVDVLRSGRAAAPPHEARVTA
jgi:MFS family permease